MSSRLSSLLIVAFAVVALVATSGCCRKPPEEIGQAEAAVAQAKENCAEVYAPDEYKKAYDTLGMAQKYGEDRKCKDARNAALETIELAKAAETRANEKKAELDAEAKKMMAELDAYIKDGESKYAALVTKKDEADQKREATLKIAEEKEFEKYGISIELKKAELDPSIEADGQAAMAQFEKAKSMYEAGGCNLFEVIAELKKVKPLGDKALAKIAENSKAIDAVVEEYNAILKTKLAELEEAMKPKYITAHTVVKGECLWKIAEMELVYNDPFQWPLIWWENQWTEDKAMNMTKEDRFNLIKDPDLIYPGQNLKIKQDLTPEEIAKAIKYAKNRYGNVDWREIPDFLTDGK